MAIELDPDGPGPAHGCGAPSAEFLAFAQVKPGMQVLDVSAGRATSQLLALAVGPTGKVWAQRSKPGAALAKRLSDQPQANLVVVIRPFEDPVPDQAPQARSGHLILNYHDITYLPVDRAKMNQKVVCGAEVRRAFRRDRSLGQSGRRHFGRKDIASHR